MEQKFEKNSIDIEALREFCEREGEVVTYRKGEQLEREGDPAQTKNYTIRGNLSEVAKATAKQGVSFDSVTIMNIATNEVISKQTIQDGLFTIHVEPDKYDFERGQKYRIVKEFFKSGQSNPQSAYCYFTLK